MRLSVTASARNCIKTSRDRAPSAMRKPISRVRSVTESSMMFMMPMPPTSSDTPGHACQQQRHRPARALQRVRQLLERQLLQAGRIAA